MAKNERPKVVDLDVYRDEMNKRLDESIVDLERAKELERIADATLDALDGERLMNGDVDVEGETP